MGEVEVCGSTAVAGREPTRGPARDERPRAFNTGTPATSSCWPTPTSRLAVVPAQVRGRRSGRAPTAPPTQVWTLHGADTGYDSVTFSPHLEATGPGASVFQLTRVGDGPCLLTPRGTARGCSTTIGPTVRERTALTRGIAPAMCAFTAAGC